MLCFCSASSSSSPHITESPTDTTPPVISNCPSSFAVSPNSGETAALVNWVAPTATDDSGTVNTDSTHTPPALFGPGPNTVVYTFSDPAGNEVECRFVVTVTRKHDLTVPAIINC